jgi:hypothetical protein
MMPAELTPTQLLSIFAKFFESQQIPYRVVGSMASMAYGEPRMTIDVDIVAELHSGHVAAIIAAFPAPEYYVSESAAIDAIRRTSQFNVIHIPSGLKVDVIVPEKSDHSVCEQSRVRRLSDQNEFSAWYAAPEDVILNKLRFLKLSGGQSQKHVRDIGGMLKISEDQIDRNYIQTWAEKLNVLNEWQLILMNLNDA